jgi:hypothetical protein
MHVPERSESVVVGRIDSETAGHKPVTSGFAVVEVMTRYLNNSALLDDLRYASQAAMAPSGDDEPELGGERRAMAAGRWAVADRLTAGGLRGMVECYRSGMIVRDGAEKFAVSPSSVKRILRQAGVRKRRPG